MTLSTEKWRYELVEKKRIREVNAFLPVPRVGVVSSVKMTSALPSNSRGEFVLLISDEISDFPSGESLAVFTGVTVFSGIGKLLERGIGLLGSEV